MLKLNTSQYFAQDSTASGVLLAKRPPSNSWFGACHLSESERVLKYVSAKTFWKYWKSASISGNSALGSGGTKPGSSINSHAGKSMPHAFERPA
ncbi:hypothetical protein D9M69_734120 [compost metagenome]